MADKTIEEVKKNKISLETELAKLLSDFEKDNGILVRYFSINREHICDCERPQPCGCCGSVNDAPHKPGSIKDVSVEVDLDLLF